MPDASNKGESKGGSHKNEGQGRDYRDTLFLPATDFPMRAGLPKREPEWLARWAQLGMYKRLREAAKGREKYILHDGPPYANGHLHMGHAFNKVLKDLVVRSRQMVGFDANYVPGWDCHGLPIEWKVEEEFRAQGKAKRDIPVAEFRKACRDYAAKWIDVQREEFKRYGVEGDWDNPYTTMAFDAEAAIVAEFLKFVEGGLVYRGSKPVMWSPVEQTALAEAEIEYHDKTSTTIWVKFPVVGSWIFQDGSWKVDPLLEYEISAETDEMKKEHLRRQKELLENAQVVIWTTTPWTIPGNRAISFSKFISYGVYEVLELAETDFTPWCKLGDKFVLAHELAEETLEKAFVARWKSLGNVDPLILQTKIACSHPLRGSGYDFYIPLLEGEHVTAEAGTGFVHTAPGHGADDYNIWMRYTQKEFPVDRYIPHTVDEFGAFTSEAPGFEGAKIIVTEGKKKGKDGDANDKVIKALIEHGALLARGRLTHSYPHSWRSKAPVIFRNTAQWFIAMDKPMESGKTLRQTALAAIDDTAFTPASGKNRIRSMVEGRPDWLISRQRAWGVPITIFAHRDTGEPLNDPAVNQRIIEAVRERGADAWFETPAQDFLGSDYSANEYEKIEDILDVWFDSGSTHAFCLEQRDDLKWPADLYLEGSDQHRGWFQSSLLESCGTRGRAPYDAVLTHGFVLDAEGRKMSKSLGNVVDPGDVMSEYGADILRIWTASSDYSEDLRIGKEIIGSSVDAYRKLRNTLRYLLGALDGFEEAERLPAEEMPELERYILHRLAVLDGEVRAGYEKFDFKAVWRRCFDFASLELSAFYLDVRKDSLYCDRPDSNRRRAARTVMDLVFDRLVAWIAPICVFTAEEAWQTRCPSVDGSVHLTLFPQTPAAWRDDRLAEKWRKVREVRRVVTGALEVERREKRIGASLEAAPVVHVADAELRKVYDGLDAAELFITSGATLTGDPAPANAFRLEGETGDIAVAPAKADGEKCRRCWRVLPEVGANKSHPDLCGRCADAVDAYDAKTA